MGKKPLIGWLINNRNVLLTVLEAASLQFWVPAWSNSDEETMPGYRLQIYSIFTQWRAERGIKPASDFYKGTKLLDKDSFLMTSSYSNHLLKTLPTNTVITGSSVSTCEYWRIQIFSL